MKKKHQFHCQTCNSPCTIYKSGKNHRVLVCPSCGVLATNPISLGGGFLGKAYRTAKNIPVVGAVASGLEEFGIVRDTGNPKLTGGQSKTGYSKMVTDSLDKPNRGERYVKMALGGQ